MQVLHSLPNLFQIWHKEFQGYNAKVFQRDLLAGITVAAVALPLALAFGVASGATAAAGLVTAILAGFIIGVTHKKIGKLGETCPRILVRVYTYSVKF